MDPVRHLLRGTECMRSSAAPEVAQAHFQLVQVVVAVAVVQIHIVDLVRGMRWPLRLAPSGVCVAKAGPHFREAEFTCDGREVCVHQTGHVVHLQCVRPPLRSQIVKLSNGQLNQGRSNERADTLYRGEAFQLLGPSYSLKTCIDWK